MKKNTLACCLAALTMFTFTGCAAGSTVVESAITDQDTGSVSEEEITEEVQPSEEAADEASSEASAEEASSTEKAAVKGEQAAGTENTADAATTAESTTVKPEVEFTPEEIVEPEIATEEVTEPVEVPAVEQPAEEAASEDDNVLDIVFIGDSQFDNARDTGSSIPEYTCALFDSVRSYNLAIGGTAASLERGASPDINTITDSCFVTMCYALSGDLKDTSFLDKYPAGEVLKTVDPAKVDVYVIEYGANDYINGKDFWNPEDAYDIHTYRGALNTGVNVLRNISPNAKFVICGPSYCMWYNSDGYVIGDSYTVSKGIGTLSEYNDIAQNFADDEGLMFIDTMYATWFDLKITTVDDYLSDGLHYKEKGRQIYAKTLAHFIKKTVGIDDGELAYMEIGNFSFW